MNYNTIVLLSSSVLVAAGIGWVRYKKIDSVFTPFILCLSVAVLNELCSFLITKAGITTAYNNNIYVLIEAMLITWQFKNWGVFNHSMWFNALMIIIPTAWIIENCIVFQMSQISIYFRIGYSYLIVMMSINLMASLILTFRNILATSAECIICMGFIIYFTNKILFEAFWLYGLHTSQAFMNNVFLWQTFINVLVNLIYATAILWIPKKPQYITLF